MMNKGTHTDYYLGLDIGTNSVGWAATDMGYNLLKFKKKTLWGMRLIESANTAEARRLKRNMRRRLERRKQRIDLLQFLFAEEMAKVDPAFFIRLDESQLYLEDKSTSDKYPLFNDPGYTDRDFYKEYPTIYHLRKELIENKEPHDIRLVYLALHHIIKRRGHFLFSGEMNGANNFSEVFGTLLEKIESELYIRLSVTKDEKTQIEELLKDKNKNNSTKERELNNIFKDNYSYVGDTDEDEVDDKKIKNSISNICKLLAGNKGDVKKIFLDDSNIPEKTSFKFDGNYEDKTKVELEETIPEQMVLIETIKAIYDWSLFAEMLEDEEYLSYAKVKRYEKHGENLRRLRKLFMKYCDKKTYNKFFNDENEKGNYVSYIGHVKKNGKKYNAKSKCDEDTFYDYLKKELNKINPDPDDIAEYERIKADAENKNLLPLQKDKNNGVVPKQIREAELKRILDNAKGYLDFLNRNEDGKTVADKIIDLFNYRIPYYVGPLTTDDKCENAWLVRKDGGNGMILPWNFEDKVDLEKSNEKFIERLTNKCTYLIDKNVVPKNSLLYSSFMVLNELNNLKVNGRKISVQLKQDIYNNLFTKTKKVTGKKLAEYLNRIDPQANEGDMYKVEDLSGFDIDFKASLGPWQDFYKIFGEHMAEDKYKVMAEDIIKKCTIYGDDSVMIERTVKAENYGIDLTNEQIKAIKKLRYSGWGSLSKEFLTEIDPEIDRETDEHVSIMDMLWRTNENLMQLLSSDHKYIIEIDEYRKKLLGKKEITYDGLIKDLYLSPSVKRVVWEVIRIVEEIVKVMGCPPKRIFVEMAREEENDPKRKDSRKKKLIDLYKNIKGESRDWIKEIEGIDDRKFNSMKLFLYYTQMGKCMYSGEEIDLDDVLDEKANKWYDRDHIYPQSKIKDDSINNLVLVRKDLNAKKSDGMIDGETQHRMYSHWNKLLDNGLITKEKYDRLTRKNDFTDDELSGFIARQMVETRQASKVVCELLDRMYKDDYKTETVYVKAGLVSDFRKWPLNVMKSRMVNDYHHAKDAYLNIVVGNVYNAKFTSDPRRWIKENRKKLENGSAEAEKYSLNAVFYWPVKRNDEIVWVPPTKGPDGRYPRNEEDQIIGGTLDLVRKTMRRNDILYTEFTYCEKGQLFDETRVRKTAGAKIPLKKGMDPAKYGGYMGAGTSYFTEIEFDGKKGERVKQIVGVPIYVANMQKYNNKAVLEYLTDTVGLKNVKIQYEKIKKNSLIIVDGYPMRIRGENEILNMFKNNLQFKVSSKEEEVIRKVEKYLDKGKGLEIDEKHDGFTKDDLINLYDLLTEKLETIYKTRPANQCEKLKEGRDKFVNDLSNADCAKVVGNMLNFVTCGNETKADLSLIGGSANSGNMAISKNTVGKSNLTLVNQSVTGIFENRIKL